MGIKQVPETGKWQARWRDPSGRQRAKTFDRRRDAERFEREQILAVQRGEWVDPAGGRMTVAEAADLWYRSRQSTWKHKTQVGYASIIRSQIVPRFGDRQLRTIRPSDIQGWISDRAGEVSPHRVRHGHRVLSQILAAAVDDGLIPQNPAAKVRLPPLPKKQARPLTPEQVEMVAAAMPHPMYGTVVRVLGTVGLRWGECAGLQVGDLDGRTLWIRRSVSEAGGTLEVTTPKTHTQRKVPLPKLLAAELAALCEGRDRDDWIFEGPRGGPLRYSSFRENRWHPAVQSVGLPHTKLHSLRDTAASELIRKGANVKAVQRVLGHASAAMTLDVYGHFYESDLDDLANLLDT